MKPIVCVSSEGQDTKIVILSKEKDKVKIRKTFSMVMAGAHDFNDPMESQLEATSLAGVDSDFSIEGVSDNSQQLASIDKNDINFAANYFGTEELKGAEFVPVITDPIVNHHNFTGHISKNKKKNIEAIKQDILKTKNVTINSDSIDYIQISDSALHSVFIREDNTSVNFINEWATHNKNKFYKIATVKNSETALGNFVAKSNDFFEEDYTLIINTGQESSKLIFLKGKNLHHIGSSLDIGTKDIHTYDVYFSKILLEMENGGIPRLDNVILCGDDNSENLVLSFFGTFPEANVTELQFDQFDLTSLSEEEQDSLSSFAFPIAAGLEYFEEKSNAYKGINFFPKYIQENQKLLQFGWHAILVLPLLFAAAFFFTFEILENDKTINEQQREIIRLTQLKAQNSLIISQMDNYTDKINNFDVTQAKLDSVAIGSETWGRMLTKVSDFMERRRNFWVSSLANKENQTINLTGYTLSRNVLNDFVENSSASSLNTVTYEPLRETKTYSYKLNFDMITNGAITNEP